MSVEVRAESPRQPDVARLIEAADTYAASLYPAESNHLLDIGSLSSPDVRFFVARLGAWWGAGPCVSIGDIGPFGDYREDPLSVFLEKRLA